MPTVNTLAYGKMSTMVRKGTGAKRLDEPTLTSSDWVEGALQLISEAGLRAFTVEALATRLGVTKGSFYWHFKGRSEGLLTPSGDGSIAPPPRPSQDCRPPTHPRQRSTSC